MKNPYEPPSDSHNLSKDGTTTRPPETKLMSTLGTAMLVSSIIAQAVCFSLLLLREELGDEWAVRMLLVAAYAILSAPFAEGVLAAVRSRNVRQEYRELIIAGGVLVGITSSILLSLFTGKWALQLV
ncbi:MAG: hypothetical protein AAF394_02915 [Planctomycetota bacterium]